MLCCNKAVAQGNTPMPQEDSVIRLPTVRVDKVFIVGNRKTKEKIILREMHVKEGDALEREELIQQLEKDKGNILNTRLFLSVYTNVIEVKPNVVDVIVRVSERWYLFPSPIFELADRNFNDWWVNHNRDLSRINYGLKLYRYNMRGANETLKLMAQFGYTKKFQVMYAFPYINAAQKVGMSLVAEHVENDNFSFTTIGDKQKDLSFLETRKWLLKETRLGVKFSYRRSFYNSNFLSLDYFHNRIKDTVAVLNPDYFLDGRLKQQYFRLQYTFVRDLRDVSAYPLQGFLIKFNITKLGIGVFDDINQLDLGANYAQFLDLGSGFYYSTEVGGMVSFPKKQPYHNFNALGFEPYDIRGYELFVIEGQHLFYNRNTLKLLVFQKNFNNRLVPIRQFQSFPISIYMKSFLDVGYVKNSATIPEGTRFVNTPLIGGGVGFDIVTYYDMSVRLEYSVNKASESGFVLGIRRTF